MERKRLKKNLIYSLCMNENIEYNLGTIKQHIREYYKSSLGTAQSRLVSLKL